MTGYVIDAPAAWEHYSNVGAYDTFYIAAARAMGVPLLTADGRLARSATGRCRRNGTACTPTSRVLNNPGD